MATFYESVQLYKHITLNWPISEKYPWWPTSFGNLACVIKKVLNSSKYVISLDRVSKFSHITDNCKAFNM